MPPDSSPAAATAPDLSKSPPDLFTLFIAFAKMSLAGFGGVLVWARRGIVDQHKWMTADEFNETFALCHFLPGPNIVNLTFVFGSRLRGIPGAIAAFSGLVGPPALIMVVMGMLYHRYGEIDALRRGLRGDWLDARGGVPDDDAAAQAARRDRASDHGRGLCRDRHPAPAIAGSVAGGDSDLDRHYVLGEAGGGMNSDSNPVLALALTFATMSLFAVGGANSAIPEMHRVAVDVNHWLTDKQFTDVYAIAQLSPGPNVLIVTLIGYSVAGLLGALVATIAMCVPTAVLALFVSRFLNRASEARWPGIVQTALVPLSIGLMGASGFILARTSDQTVVAALVTIGAAVLASVTKLNPLWMLVAGGCLGFAGLIG
jgi:chromate transporter